MIENHDIIYRRDHVSATEFAEILDINLATLEALEGHEGVPNYSALECNYKLNITEMRLQDEIMDNIHLRQLITDAREVLRNFLEKGWSKESLVALKDKLRREL